MIRLVDAELTFAQAAIPPLPPRANAGMAPNAIRQSRITRQPRQICTHTTVRNCQTTGPGIICPLADCVCQINRVRGVACSMCGRVPDHGWVYQCRQDYSPHKDDPLPDVDCMPTVPDECDYFDAKSRVAEHLKVSTSGLLTSRLYVQGVLIRSESYR